MLSLVLMLIAYCVTVTLMVTGVLGTILFFSKQRGACDFNFVRRI